MKAIRQLLFLFSLFVFVSFISPTESHFVVRGKAIQSSCRGDLYGFDVHVFGMENMSFTSIDVYLQIVLPEGGIKLYQLDYLRHSNKEKIRNYVSYSCELCLTQIGKYQAMYFITDQHGNKTFDSQIYEFAVFPAYKSNYSIDPFVPKLK